MTIKPKAMTCPETWRLKAEEPFGETVAEGTGTTPVAVAVEMTLGIVWVGLSVDATEMTDRVDVDPATAEAFAIDPELPTTGTVPASAAFMPLDPTLLLPLMLSAPTPPLPLLDPPPVLSAIDPAPMLSVLDDDVEATPEAGVAGVLPAPAPAADGSAAVAPAAFDAAATCAASAATNCTALSSVIVWRAVDDWQKGHFLCPSFISGDRDSQFGPRGCG